MNQQPLFCDDFFEALKTIGQAFGGSKKMGAFLWPDKPIDKASELWANCLNRARPEKLDPEQVLLVLKIGRQIGCHAGIQFISEHCGYKYEPVEPEDEKAKLQRLYIQSVEAQKDLVRRMEALDK